MSDLLEGLLAPLRAVLVALVGLWLALQWSEGELLVPSIIVAGVFTVGYFLDYTGRQLLPNRPVPATLLLEFWLLAPLMLAATASALIVVLAISLGISESSSPEAKELAKALAAALTAFLTSGFISWAGDQDNSYLARRIQRAFQDKYQRRDEASAAKPGVIYFAPESAGELWVQSESYGGATGWGHGARLSRARGIREELRTHNSDPPPPAN